MLMWSDLFEFDHGFRCLRKTVLFGSILSLGHGGLPAAAATAMPSTAEQGTLASAGTRGAPLVVSDNADLVAKAGTAQDSWFVISHLTSGRDMLDLMIHYIRLTPIKGEPFVQSIMSVLDPVTGKSISEELVQTVPETTFSTDRLDVVTPSGSMTGTAAEMKVTGNFKRVRADLTLSHRGPMLANVGNGLLPFYGDINYEYALPDMATSGIVTIDGKRYVASGTSWFDRQWGQMAPSFWTQRQWTWFGMSLDNGDRISLWDIIYKGKSNAFATVLHPDGRHEVVDVVPVAGGATEPWVGPSGQRYPTRWTLSIPQLKATLTIVPRVREQEVVSPVKAHKYEGASSVSGTVMGRPVRGHAVAELVGDWN